MSAKVNQKAIISCAITGSIHTPSMSPYLPVTAEEIAESAIAAARAGAAIVHLHARDPQTGKPTQNPDCFLPFVRKIKNDGGRSHQPDERRRADHADRGAHWASHEVEAGTGFAQHGVD